MKIGIAITTTPKRSKLLEKCIKNISEYTDDYYLYVHNDKEYKGIAYSKNKCIENLMDNDCDYLFLFDDDCYPIKKDWEKVFINSKLNHAALTFTKLANGKSNGNVIRKTQNGIDIFINPCGIMLFFKRQTIDIIGGNDVRYSQWGHEHVGLSSRIFNAGLTPAPFICPVGAMEYFYSLDQQQFGAGTFTIPEQQKMAKIGAPIYAEEKQSIDWKPYKKQDFVLSSYFTRNIDVQRRKFAPASPSAFKKWEDSIIELGMTGIMFNDCFKNISNKNLKYVRAICPRNVDLYNFRHSVYLEWLKRNRQYVNNVYMTDCTDVEFYQIPPIEKGFIYLGSENETCDLNWLKGIYTKFTKKKQYPIEKLSGKVLLNCGIIYGHVDDVIDFLQRMVTIMKGEAFIDMFALNWVGHIEIPHKIKTGYPIHTEFRKEQCKESGAYIRHK
jgi:hypothetical protein